MDRLTSEELRLRQKARMARYYAANKDKFRAATKARRAANPLERRAHDARYREKNAEKVRASKETYRLANLEKVAAAKTKWRENNPEKMQACREKWIATGDNKAKRRVSIKAWQDQNIEKVKADTKKYRESHKEQMREWVSAWGKRNPHKLRAYVMRRQAAQLKATPAWADLEAIQDVYQEAAYMQMQVDHIVPLRSKVVCGLHVWDNLQLLSRSENSAKSNRYWPDMP